MNPQRRNVCVFCGSRMGARSEYGELARVLGRGLAEAGIGLVYGAGDRGLMGEAASAAIEAGGFVTGFIPRHLLQWEVGKADIDALIVTETMHERKKLMFSNSDLVIALPGGPGTLDELIEVLTWRQLGLHDRKVVLVDFLDYWAPLRALLRHMAEQGFCDPGFEDYLTVVRDAEGALDAVRAAFSARSASRE